MRKIILLMIVLLPTGCATQYQKTMYDVNASIAESNSEIAQACVDGLKSTADPAAIVAISLTVCQKQQKFMEVAPPEKIGDIIKQLVFASVPWAFVEMGRAARGPTNYEVGGDYVTNNGPGSAGTSREFPTEVIIMGEEN